MRLVISYESDISKHYVHAICRCNMQLTFYRLSHAKRNKITASGLISRHFSPTAQLAHCDRNASDQHQRKHYVANTLTHLGGKRPHLRIRYPHRNRPTLSSMKSALPATPSFEPNWDFRWPTAKTRSRKVAQSTLAAERR